MRRITEQEELKAIELYKEGKSAKTIANELGFSQMTILNTLKKHGIERRTKAGINKVNFDPDEVINLYNSGLSAYEIQDIVGCKSVNTIYNFIRQHCQIRNGRHGLNWNANMNKNFFKEPLSERAQYWLGFLFADGSVYTPNRESRNPVISLEVAVKDDYLIHEFKKDLNLDNKVQYRTKDNGSQFCRIQFASKEIADDLAKYGILPNKTFHVDQFIGEEDTLTGHMLRGFMDGDGWVTSVNDSSIAPAIGFVGNYYTMEMLRRILANRLKVNPDVHIDMNVEKNRWPKIVYRRIDDVIKLYEFMYPVDTTLFLSRKKDKLIEFWKNRQQKNLSIPLPSLWETIE